MTPSVDDRGLALRGHPRPGFNRCLVCRQKVRKHSDGINVGAGLVHVKSCARRWRKGDGRSSR